MKDWDDMQDYWRPWRCGPLDRDESAQFWELTNFKNAEHKEKLFESAVDEFRLWRQDAVAEAARVVCTTYYNLIWPPESGRAEDDRLYHQGQRFCDDARPIYEQLTSANAN